MRGIVEAAGTPWGSVHHYWPDGKEQLGVAAVQFGDQTIGAPSRRCLGAGQLPGAAVAGYLSLVLSVLEGSGWRRACPVTTVALEVTSDGHRCQRGVRSRVHGMAIGVGERSGRRHLGSTARELATTVVGAHRGCLDP